MIALEKRSPSTLQALGAILLFSTAGTAQIPRLCNTGQTRKNIDACTGEPVTPNPTGGGSQRDGNGYVAYPYPSTLAEAQNPCTLGYIKSYVYLTFFPVPDSPAPTGFTINGQLASDNATVAVYLRTPAGAGHCALVSGQSFPVNPGGSRHSDFQQWWPFSFTNTQPLAVASPAALYLW